jgi:hypothetical protein
MEYGTLDIAEIMATAYKGTILPDSPLDNVEEPGYNDCVVFEKGLI